MKVLVEIDLGKGWAHMGPQQARRFLNRKFEMFGLNATIIRIEDEDEVS